MPEDSAVVIAVEMIKRRSEAMASKITDQMAIAHEHHHQEQLDWLHSLVQDLLVIRQQALAIEEVIDGA